MSKGELVDAIGYRFGRRPGRPGPQARGRLARRAGLAAQGAVYALIGVLALQVAVDGRDSAAKPDKEGALQLVVDQPFGKVLLGLLALGFAAYALWRIAQAIVDRKSKGSDAKALGKRVGYRCLGLWYSVLAVLAISKLSRLELRRLRRPAPTSRRRLRTSSTCRSGGELVLGVAAGFVTAAGLNIYRAFSGKLERHLDPR